jgi:phosphoribosylformylglycinamidine synthase subunit PurL
MGLTSQTASAWTEAEAREPEAVSARLRALGVMLDPEEVTLLASLLGRPPLWPEAVLFGILWSEHCSYKSSRHLLSRLPTQAPQVILGPGEDAGVVALPSPCADLALVLAHESHNHPSQVLPVEGAATGVGGIVRDVGCMGAEVVGVLDALRFGDPRAAVHTRDVVRGVVQGIADYGNALGVPNLGGDVTFDARFDLNCLVNVMSVGLAPVDGILRSRVPEGAGPWVFVLTGKPTDESGFGGAAFASGELGGDQRGAVQLPDPFLKRVLHVANAEAFVRIRSRGLPAGFKDLGAGGVACATSELAAAGGRGADIRLDEVHRVERDVPPEVLLCAETQERFCWVVREDFADELCDLYNREFALADVYPGAGARKIGRATDDGRYRVTWNGETLVDCDVEAITTGRRVPRVATRREPARAWKRERGQRSRGPRESLLRLLKSWNLCSREYLFRHYDSEVQGRTWLRPGEGDAVVIRAHAERSLGLAFAVGGNPHWCAADPRLGAAHAVAEAARNVACVGARPWALTDCLNFGHPGDASVMGDFEATIDGLAEAAHALGSLASPGAALPFVSGNVSLHNQSGERAIPPSPIVMCAGVLDLLSAATGIAIQSAGDFLVLVGEPREGLSGSAYVRDVLNLDAGAPPPLDLEREARLQELAVRAAGGRWVRAAHDVSDGGLAVCLAEMAMACAPELALGIDVDLGSLGAKAAEALFSERPAIVFEVSPERAARLFQAARDLSLDAWPIGSVAARADLRVLCPGGKTVEWKLDALRAAAAAPFEKLWNEETT